MFSVHRTSRMLDNNNILWIIQQEESILCEVSGDLQSDAKSKQRNKNTDAQ